MKKGFSFALALILVLMLGVSAYASGEASGETAAAPVVELTGPETKEISGWMYTVEGEEITVIQAPQLVKDVDVILVPGYVAGEQVDSFGNGGSVMSNNKRVGTWALFAKELGYLADSSIHDFNDTVAWVIPATVQVGDAPWLSCSGYVVTEEGSSAAASAALNGKQVAPIAGCAEFVVAADTENGWISPAGTYSVPADVYGMATAFSVSAAQGYKIASITVDGVVTEFSELTQEFYLTYTFSADSTGVDAVFVPLGEGEKESRTFASGTSYAYTEIVDGAVAAGVELPEDLYTVSDPNAAVTDYVNALGVSTGVYYINGDSLYEQVYCSQSSTEVEYLTKAEAINDLYLTHGLVYGEDYDILRLHNYYENITNGPARGVVSMYCTYCYKLVDETSADGSLLDGQVVYSANNTNNASLFAQGVGKYTINDLIAYCYTGGRGPSESGNFYGVGSQIHADGGLEGKIKQSDRIAADTTVTMVLNQPKVLGTNNAVYSTAKGIIEINGGDIFAASSGGHGPYVSQGGQIFINTEGTNLINADGSINIEDPEAVAIPDYSYAAMGQDAEGNNCLVLTEHPDDVTVIVSGLDAGTALATDKGGGTIVANQVVTKCYGLRSAGVYTIGHSESWVYVYNSDCTSNLDAALCSASAGYGYAFNCRLQGCMGLKVRASGNTSTENAGLWVENCRISAFYDAQAEEDAYVVGSPDEFIAHIGEAAGIEPQGANESYADYLKRADAALTEYIVNQGNDYGSRMNIFIDPANFPKYNENGILWWYLDRSKTPGYSGGNKFAVIYSDGSPAVVNVSQCLLVNDNYTLYGPESEWWNGLTEAEKAIYTPADNLIASAENGGKLNVTFTNQNSATKWDVTGASDETCEMVGDFYVGPKSTNAVNATLVNSEWTGTVIYADPSLATSGEMGADAVGFSYITLTDGSVWTVTEECTVHGLTVDETSRVIGNITENEDGSFTVTPADQAPAAPAASGEPSAEPASGEPAGESEADIFNAYIQYLRDYMAAYAGEGDGSGFDDAAKAMAIGELDTVAYGDDVNAFPIEMFVSQFGADHYDVWVASR